MSLRDLVLSTNLAAFGVSVTVTPKDGAPITTTGLWDTPTQEDTPFRTDFQRREPIRVMALSRDDVPVLPTGSTVLAPERRGGTAVGWRVDGTEREEAEHRRVILVRDESADEDS